MPDVEHALFSVEVKYRKALPRLLRLGLDQAASYDRTKPPLLVVKQKHQKGALVILKLADFVDLFGPLVENAPEGEQVQDEHEEASTINLYATIATPREL